MISRRAVKQEQLCLCFYMLALLPRHACSQFCFSLFQILKWRADFRQLTCATQYPAGAAGVNGEGVAEGVGEG